MNTMMNRMPAMWAAASAPSALRMLAPAVSTLLPAQCRHISVSASASAAETAEAAEQAAQHTPAYTIEDVDETGSAVEDGVRVSWYTRKRVLGEPKKLVHLLRQIRGLSVPEAIAQMDFSAKSRGPVVASAIKQAAKRADFYHDLTPNELMIDQAIVGKDGQGMKKLRYHSRGRFGISVKRWSRITVTVREMTLEERDALTKFKPGTQPPRMHNAEARAY